MSKRRRLALALLCIVSIYVTMQSTAIITTTDFYYVVKQTFIRSGNQYGRENLTLRHHHINTTSNSTKIKHNDSSKPMMKDKQFSNVVSPNSNECERRKSGTIRMSDKQLPMTALASPFRSGNTWVRHLLQMATGIGTSSIYCDDELRANGFPFECNHIHYKRMIAVKTHESHPYTARGQKTTIPFERAILVIRDPYNFIVGNMNAGHMDVVKEEAYFREEGHWRKNLGHFLTWWTNFNDNWLTTFRGPLYPLLYSNLLTNTEMELRNLLTFLNITYTDSDLTCAINNKEGNFHRKPMVWTKINNIKELFNNTMRLKIDKSLKMISKTLEEKYNVKWVDENHVVRVT